MAYAPSPKDAEISISVFGGKVSEMAPPDVPEGVSPDCADVIFTPGNVSSREALQKVFATPFPGLSSVTYAKSFVDPTGITYNLYLDSNNILWIENLTDSPGFYTQLSTVLGTWGKSITAFGREYIAVSDSLHGTDIPLQYDGTFLDRVTQDGPGAPPAVQSIALPSVGLGTGPSVAPISINNILPADAIGFWVFCNSSIASIFPGMQVTISGNTVTFYNTTWTVSAVYPASNTIFVSAYTPVGGGTGGTITGASGVSLLRQNNVVTAYTNAVHQLQVGYQAQIAGVPASTVGTGVAGIVINNEDDPGIATITTSSAHGLVPGIFVSITGINPVVVGTSISTVVRAGQVVTVTTSSNHNLTPGAIVTLGGVSDASFDVTAQVAYVIADLVFTFYQADVDASSSGGSVSLNWPIPNTATPTYFEVLTAPTATTFQVSITYSDGTWTSGGIVTYAWNGTFYVSAVLSTTAFQYQQYGPDATYTVNSGETITPYGQASPGIHQCQMSFLTRQGFLTKPSPPVKFVANGGQYLSVTNLAIGPSNIVARVLEFTGVSGATFFYIPSTPQVNGQIVGTSTQVNDNSSTSVLLDFSDPTLFSATGISIPGNNLSNQIVIDSALAFGSYAGRLMIWGMRNRIQNFLNLSFDGGQFYSAVGADPSNFPCGWIIGTGPNGGGSLVTTGRWAGAWQGTGTGSGSIYQSAYEDAYGAPILTASTKYKLRAWVNGSSGSALVATISSASAGFTAIAVVDGTINGSFGEGDFSLEMPEPIPSDMVLTLTWDGNPIIDEISIIYQDNPYLDTVIYASYVQNPEGIDGVTGKFGSLDDTHKVMDMAEIRKTLYVLTQEPGGRLHNTSDNGVTEPAGWDFDEVAANCGLLSAFGLTKSQADNSSASGGEEWFAWASASGARIFGGAEPWKLSQEIQPDWAGAKISGASQWSSAQGINPAYNSTTWALNDSVARRMYFGIPANGSTGTASQVLMLDYQGLSTAADIGNTGAIRISFSGKLIATDHARKWSPWNRTINGAALMYRQAGQLQPVFFAGNGLSPGVGSSFGNVYTLNAEMLTDDDYGQINPYYTTFLMPSHDQEQALQLSGGRKLLVYFQAFIAGVGILTITPICDTLTNPWNVVGIRTLSTNPKFDTEWIGGNAQAQRMAIKFASSPSSGTDNSFNLQKVVAYLRRAVHLPVRGSAT